MKVEEARVVGKAAAAAAAASATAAATAAAMGASMQEVPGAAKEVGKRGMGGVVETAVEKAAGMAAGTAGQGRRRSAASPWQAAVASQGDKGRSSCNLCSCALCKYLA